MVNHGKSKTMKRYRKRYVSPITGKPMKGGIRATCHHAVKPKTGKYKMISSSGVSRSLKGKVHTTSRLHTTNRKNVNAHYKPKTTQKDRYIGKTTTKARKTGKRGH